MSFLVEFWWISLSFYTNSFRDYSKSGSSHSRSLSSEPSVFLQKSQQSGSTFFFFFFCLFFRFLAVLASALFFSSVICFLRAYLALLPPFGDTKLLRRNFYLQHAQSMASSIKLLGWLVHLHYLRSSACFSEHFEHLHSLINFWQSSQSHSNSFWQVSSIWHELRCFLSWAIRSLRRTSCSWLKTYCSLFAWKMFKNSFVFTMQL